MYGYHEWEDDYSMMVKDKAEIILESDLQLIGPGRDKTCLRGF